VSHKSSLSLFFRKILAEEDFVLAMLVRNFDNGSFKENSDFLPLFMRSY
jgi:hypothetical protein